MVPQLSINVLGSGINDRQMADTKICFRYRRLECFPLLCFGIESNDLHLRHVPVVNAALSVEIDLKAALRNLANAASLLKENPALLQLRLVQQLAATTGHTVVIGQAPLGA